MKWKINVRRFAYDLETQWAENYVIDTMLLNKSMYQIWEVNFVVGTKRG